MRGSPATRWTTGRGASPRPHVRRGVEDRARSWARRHPWAGDVGGAVCAALLALPFVLERGGAGSAALAALVVAAPLLWRRRRPVPVFAAVLALAVVSSALAGHLLRGTAVLVLVALYAVAVRVRGPVLWAVVAAAETAAMVSALSLRGVRSPDGEVFSVWTVLPVLAALPTAVAALGANRRVRRDHLAALEERAQRLESEREQRDVVAGAAERARIAREMHDLVAHSLTVVVTLADGLAAGAAHVPPRPPDPRALAALASTGREALGEMRHLLGVLAEDGPEDDHLRDPGAAAPHRSPQPGAGDLDALVERSRTAGVHVTLTREGAVAAAGSAVGLTVYRIVQEALTNTLKHAGPGSSATVVVAASPGRVRVRVHDDGLGRVLGTRPAGAPDAPGGRLPGSNRGLRGMRERAVAFGGTVTAGPARPSGWRVEVDLVVEDDAGGAHRPGRDRGGRSGEGPCHRSSAPVTA